MAMASAADDGLTSGQRAALAFWGANMGFLFRSGQEWPGFGYTEAEKARLVALGATVPPAATAIWMLLVGPVLFILFAAAMIACVFVPVLSVLYPNPADVQPLPFVLLLASVAAVSILGGMGVLVTLGARLALAISGRALAAATQDPGDAALYRKVRWQILRIVLVVCGLFVPLCTLWIVFDLSAGPWITALKWLALAALAASGLGLWRARP